MPVAGFTGWFGTVLDAADPVALGRFYSDLLGWPLATVREDWVTLAPEGAGTAYLGIHVNPVHEPPVWPSELGRPQQQAHLDVGVRDLAAAVADAERLGARLHDHQPQDDVRVMVDPAGHLFCLYEDRHPGPEPVDR